MFPLSKARGKNPELLEKTRYSDFFKKLRMLLTLLYKKREAQGYIVKVPLLSACARGGSVQGGSEGSEGGSEGSRRFQKIPKRFKVSEA